MDRCIFAKIEQMFGDLAINLALNVGLDGSNIYKSQKKYLAKQVGLFN
jgi:hypothetical protein